MNTTRAILVSTFGAALTQHLDGAAKYASLGLDYTIGNVHPANADAFAKAILGASPHLGTLNLITPDPSDAPKLLSRTAAIRQACLDRRLPKPRDLADPPVRAYENQLLTNFLPHRFTWDSRELQERAEAASIQIAAAIYLEEQLASMPNLAHWYLPKLVIGMPRHVFIAEDSGLRPPIAAKVNQLLITEATKVKTSRVSMVDVLESYPLAGRELVTGHLRGSAKYRYGLAFGNALELLYEDLRKGRRNLEPYSGEHSRFSREGQYHVPRHRRV